MQELMELASSPIKLVTELPGPKGKQLIDRQKPYLSPSLIHVYPLMVKRASGCMVEDADGNILLDCMAGIASASTGHCHPRVVSAMHEQSQKLIHICGTDFFYDGYGQLAERLAKLAPGNHQWQVFLTNSGTEATEAAIKLTRHHTRRFNLIAFRGGFHGRSMGSLSLTDSKVKYRKGFGPLVPGVRHVGFGDAEAIVDDLFATTVAPDEVAAIVVEPIQGEGGYTIPPPGFLQRLRDICDQHGILLVFDEVQSGVGRTGKFFASEHFGVIPDVYLMAKGLASGMPLGAMMARRELMTWPAGSHGSTTGGNPVCIASAMATLDLVQESLCENARVVGAFLKDRLTHGLLSNPAIVEVRGVGLMIGVEFSTPKQAHDVAELCYQRGLLVLTCGTKSIRISPPLILTEEQAAVAAEVFVGACADVTRA